MNPSRGADARSRRGGTCTLVRFLKEWTLPVAIATGVLLYLLFYLVPVLDAAGDVLGPWLDTIFPLSVFSTLFVTFCKVDFHQMRPHRWHVGVLVVQLLLTALIIGIIFLVSQSATPHGDGCCGLSGGGSEGGAGLLAVVKSKILWEAVLTCVIAPSASAAPVVVGKLGGNISTMSAFTVISSFVQALVIPMVFPLLEQTVHIGFLSAFLIILQKVSMVLVLPLLLGWLVQHHAARLHRWIAAKPNLSFYCWAFSLTITAGITVKNIVHSQAATALLLMIGLFTFALCFVQYVLGRGVGRWLGEPLNSGQALFQKNTALAIWAAYMYLSPVASIGAGCYVLWQNIINSFELWQHDRRSR